jgi:hypothetical protein
MGKASRDKGKRAELEVVHILQEHGIAASRVPLSGAAGDEDETWRGDIRVPVLGDDKRFEVKCRAGGFKQIYDWKAGHFGLVIRADRQKPLVVMSLDDWARIAIIADKNRIGELLSDLAANTKIHTAGDE